MHGSHKFFLFYFIKQVYYEAFSKGQGLRKKYLTIYGPTSAFNLSPNPLAAWLVGHRLRSLVCYRGSATNQSISISSYCSISCHHVSAGRLTFCFFYWRRCFFFLSLLFSINKVRAMSSINSVFRINSLSTWIRANSKVKRSSFCTDSVDGFTTSRVKIFDRDLKRKQVYFYSFLYWHFNCDSYRSGLLAYYHEPWGST